MAEQKIEPVPVAVQEVPSNSSSDVQPNNPSDVSDDHEQKPTEPAGHCVQEDVLDSVVAYFSRRISELERLVEKKRAAYLRLSGPQPHLHPPTMSIIPQAIPPAAVTGGALSASIAASQSTHCVRNPPNPFSNGTAVASAPQQLHQQSTTPNPPIPPALAVAAPNVPDHMRNQYPFLYSHPEHPTMPAALLGVVPQQLHPAAAAAAAAAAVPPPPRPTPTPSQLPQSSESADRRQSRYWAPDEHQRFLAAVSNFGPKCYNRIAEFVNTRTAKQVRTHAQKFHKKQERERARGMTSAHMPNLESSANPSAVVHPMTSIKASISPAPQTSHLNEPTNSLGAQNSSSSGKDFTQPQRQGDTSIDGNYSTTNASSDQNVASRPQVVEPNAAAAAVVAVAAEAAALGSGLLPSSVLNVPGLVSHPAPPVVPTQQPSKGGPLDKASKAAVLPASETPTVEEEISTSKSPQPCVVHPTLDPTPAQQKMETKEPDNTAQADGKSNENSIAQKEILNEEKKIVSDCVATFDKQATDCITKSGTKMDVSDTIQTKQSIVQVEKATVKIAKEVECAALEQGDCVPSRKVSDPPFNATEKDSLEPARTNVNTAKLVTESAAGSAVPIKSAASPVVPDKGAADSNIPDKSVAECSVPGKNVPGSIIPGKGAAGSIPSRAKSAIVDTLARCTQRGTKRKAVPIIAPPEKKARLEANMKLSPDPPINGKAPKQLTRPSETLKSSLDTESSKPLVNSVPSQKVLGAKQTEESRGQRIPSG